MSEPTTSEPRRLGDFEIVRELGRGGMGVVYEARQVSLKRKVALKVLSGQLGLTSQAVVRFRREAEAAAKLHHTNIVPIYATGEENGTHYYAMELVEGPSLNIVLRELRCAAAREPPAASRTDANTQTRASDTLPSWVLETVGAAPLAQHAEERDSPAAPMTAAVASSGAGSADSSTLLRAAGGYFDTIARLVAEVADALDYAHKQGVIHRDMKPSNLLLSPAGRLSINDFGLARVLEQPGMTMTGEFMGTPRYMSPEQIAAGRAPLDHRTDIYSLGATLYELLTLEPPFPGERREQVIAQIIGKDPTPPRRVNRKVPVDLETICLKALEKDPDRRYQTAGQMAADLRAYLNRFAISAKRAGPLTRTVKWCRRRPAVAGLLGAVVLLGAAAGVLAYGAHRSSARIVEMQRQKAIDDAVLAAMSGDYEQADAAIRQAEMLGAGTGWTRMLQGLVWLQKGDGDEAIEDLEQAVRLLPTSVAARALLDLTHLTARHWEPHYELLTEIDQLTPRTAEDFLFKGMAESDVEPTQGLPSLDEAVKRRSNWSVAYACRAYARATLAMSTGRVEDVRRALDDARIAKGLMPNNALALRTDLRAQLVAADLYSDLRDEAAREAALVEAGRDVQALESVTTAEVVNLRGEYFERYGMEKAALEEYWRTGDASTYADLLYRRTAFAEALQALDETPAEDRRFLWWTARALTVMELEGGQQEASADCQKVLDMQPKGVDLLYPHIILLMLGRKADALAVAQQSRADFARMPAWLWEWYRHVLDHRCQLISDEQLLLAATGSRMHQCEAHFYIALRRIADGDRAGAREHFRAAIDTHVFTYFEYAWSRNFLARMDQDPTWPPWIPLKEATEEAGVSPAAQPATAPQEEQP
jgi:tetratricopeptide (TPR) repeat protein